MTPMVEHIPISSMFETLGLTCNTAWYPISSTNTIFSMDSEHCLVWPWQPLNTALSGQTSENHKPLPHYCWWLPLLKIYSQTKMHEPYPQWSKTCWKSCHDHIDSYSEFKKNRCRLILCLWMTREDVKFHHHCCKPMIVSVVQLTMSEEKKQHKLQDSWTKAQASGSHFNCFVLRQDYVTRVVEFTWVFKQTGPGSLVSSTHILIWRSFSVFQT